MKRKMYQRVVCFALSALTLFGAFSIPGFAAEKVKPQTNAGSAATLEDMVALLGTSSYAAYMMQYNKEDYKDKGLETIEIPVTEFLKDSNGNSDASLPKDSDDCVKSEEKNPEDWKNFTESDWENTVYLPTTNADGTKAASVTWTINIPEEKTGVYYLEIEYFNCRITDSVYGKSSVSAIFNVFSKSSISN